MTDISLKYLRHEPHVNKRCRQADPSDPPYRTSPPSPAELLVNVNDSVHFCHESPENIF